MQTCHIVMCLQLHIVTYGCIPVSSSIDIFIRKKESSLKVVQNSAEWVKVLVHIEKPLFSHRDEIVNCELNLKN